MDVNYSVAAPIDLRLAPKQSEVSQITAKHATPTPSLKEPQFERDHCAMLRAKEQSCALRWSVLMEMLRHPLFGASEELHHSVVAEVPRGL